MSNLLADAIASLNTDLKALASEDIVYIRGAFSVPLKASLGSQLLKTTDGKGNTKTQRTDRDFIITAADLILDGQRTLPKDGDKIELTLNGVKEKYKLMPLDKEASWRNSDPNGIRIRIHTKRVGTG